MAWRAILAAGLLAACCAAQAATQVATQFADNAPDKPGITDQPAQSARVRHALRLPQLRALAGKRLRDAGASRLLAAPLARVLGGRYEAFKASMPDEKPLRLEGGGLIGEGVVPDTFAYRGAFFVFDSRGEVLAVIKGGRHGTTIERFGSLEVLKDPALLHAYQEFIGIDE
jgi:hypothetical protein